MTKFFRRFPIRVFAFAALALALAAPLYSTITYEIYFAHPERHTFHIKMTVSDVSGSLTVQMPAWNALYEIRDFASHVSQVKASNDSGLLPIEKLDKQTWRITGSGTITLEYDTFWDEPGPFSSQLNTEHAFFNPAMILMYIPERRREQLSITLYVPGDWQIVAGSRFAIFQSGHVLGLNVFGINYDHLADIPFEVGRFEYLVLPSNSHIAVVIHGNMDKRQDFESKLTKICEYEASLMGGGPFLSYTFIFHVGDNVGGGGMEHVDGTAIAARTEDGLLTIAAHEFFHLWNVKRIRPASLAPVDFTKEQYTKALWFAEGVTSTYERYTLLRTAIWTKAHFYADLGHEISDLESRPANAWQSAEQSSLDTWFEKYAIYNQPDHSVSYYTKGAVIGVLLDLWIREQTNNTRSLDDMMRALNEQFGKTGKPYRDHEDLEAVCSQTAKTSCKNFFDDYVSGTKLFPYDEYLGFAGLTIRRVTHSAAQMGTQTAFEISEDDAANEKQKRIRAGILGGVTDKALAATAK